MYEFKNLQTRENVSRKIDFDLAATFTKLNMEKAIR